jgi:hypothetical protein
MFNILLFVYFVACFEFYLQLFYVKMEIVYRKPENYRIILWLFNIDIELL